MGLLEQTGGSTFARASKGTFLITEQLTFQKTFRHGRKINCDKRSLLSIGSIVDALRQQFFTGAAFALKQDWGFRCSQFACESNCFFDDFTIGFYYSISLYGKQLV